MGERIGKIIRNKKAQWLGIFLLLVLSFGIGAQMVGSLSRQDPVNPMAEREANPSRLILSEGQILLDSGKIAEMTSANISTSQLETVQEEQIEDTEESNVEEKPPSEPQQQPQEIQQPEQEQKPQTEIPPEETLEKIEGLDELLEVQDNIEKIEDMGLIPEVGGGSQWGNRFESLAVPGDEGTEGEGGEIGGLEPGGNESGGDESGNLPVPELRIETTLPEDGKWTAANITFEALGVYGEEILPASVKVNGTPVSGNNHQFTSPLNLGENKIEITVENVQDRKSETHIITYTPLPELGIQTTLDHLLSEGTPWTEPTISFEAFGTYGEEILAASVRVNGTSVSGSAHQFTAALTPGINQIRITVANEQGSIWKTYEVIYVETQFRVRTTISDTILYGTEADWSEENAVYEGDTEAYRFQVAISNITGKERIKEVRVMDTGNGTVLSVQSDGCYHITLNPRARTTVRLTYLDSSGTSHIYVYRINYKRTYTPPEKYPNIQAMIEVNDTRINLVDGMSFKSPSVILDINATSYRGEQLYYGDYKVALNGNIFEWHEFQTGTWFGFELYLQEGENIVQIQVWDKEQYTVVRAYRIYYEPGDVTITVSVEAGTVGIPYLVEPVQVTVPGGTNLTYILVDLLDQMGYGATGNGDVDLGFYLSGVQQPGLLDRAKIPDDLLECLAADGIEVNNTTGDWLGEFNYTYYSGWMYSVNGHYPGYSMSRCKPQDGAVIRVRYTLAYGKDIGGYVSVGYPCGNSTTNYEKEW